MPNTNVVAPTVLTGELGAEIAADNPNSNISVFASVQNPVDVHGDVYAPSKDARPPQFETD